MMCHLCHFQVRLDSEPDFSALRWHTSIVWQVKLQPLGRFLVKGPGDQGGGLIFRVHEQFDNHLADLTPTIEPIKLPKESRFLRQLFEWMSMAIVHRSSSPKTGVSTMPPLMSLVLLGNHIILPYCKTNII